MHVKEPREPQAGFIWAWAALFGGIPTLVMVLAVLEAVRVDGPNGEPSSVTTWSVDGAELLPLLFLLLFPLIALLVLALHLRRARRAGFQLEPDGIRGAHDAEAVLLGWEHVERLAWFDAEPTLRMEVNGRPLPNGPALYALRHDGRRVRIMQRIAGTRQRLDRMNEQLARADAAGLLPVPYGTELEHDGGASGGHVPGPRPATTTLWSSDLELGTVMPPPPSAARAPAPTPAPVDRETAVHDEPRWPTT